MALSAQSAASRVLFWGPGSYRSWRAQLALEEKGLDYDSIPVDLGKNGAKTADVMAINPRGQVPAFKDGDVIINESGAIIEWVEAAYPGKGTKLVPEDIKDKAKMYQLMWESDNLLSKSMAVFYFNSYDTNEEEFAGKVAEFRKEVAVWEVHLGGSKGPFFVGEEFSLVDLILFPLVATCVRYGMDFAKSGFPSLAAYYDKVKARESVQKTWPPHWKTTPAYTKLAHV